MFWNFAAQVSQIETLLDKEEIILADILNEDDVLQECIVKNKKLIDYLTKAEVMSQLVDLIVKEPPEDLAEHVRFRHPNIACEILTADVEAIADALTGHPEEENDSCHDDSLLNKLISFLSDNPPPLNPLQASFFMKVVAGLISHRTQRIVSYLQSRKDFVQLLLQHLNTSAVMELLLKFVQQIDTKDMRANVSEWLNSENLIHRLIDGLNTTECDEKHYYTAYCISEMITAYREQAAQELDNEDDMDSKDSTTPILPNPLLDTIESAAIQSRLVEALITEPPSASIIISCVQIFQNILDKRTIESPFAGDPSMQLTTLRVDPRRVVIATTTLATVLLPHIHQIASILKSPPIQFFSSMPTTHCILSPPLGISRLQIARLIHWLLDTHSQPVYEAVHNANILPVLLDLFHEYPWNSFLHQSIMEMLNTILKAEKAPSYRTDLFRQLFVDCKLIDRILNWWEENLRIQDGERGCRRGYMGHLVQIANLVSARLTDGPHTDFLKDLCKEANPDFEEKWNAFVSDSLATINLNNTVDNVASLSSDVDESDFLAGFDRFSQEESMPPEECLAELVKLNQGSTAFLKFESMLERSKPHTIGKIIGGVDSDEDSDSDEDHGKVENARVFGGAGAKSDSDEEEDDDEEDLTSPIRIVQSSSRGQTDPNCLAGITMTSLDSLNDDIIGDPPSTSHWESEGHFDKKEDENMDTDFSEVIMRSAKPPGSLSAKQRRISDVDLVTSPLTDNIISSPPCWGHTYSDNFDDFDNGFAALDRPFVPINQLTTSDNPWIQTKQEDFSTSGFSADFVANFDDPPVFHSSSFNSEDDDAANQSWASFDAFSGQPGEGTISAPSGELFPASNWTQDPSSTSNNPADHSTFDAKESESDLKDMANPPVSGSLSKA